jgi:hypothetical protein
MACSELLRRGYQLSQAIEHVGYTMYTARRLVRITLLLCVSQTLLAHPIFLCKTLVRSVVASIIAPSHFIVLLGSHVLSSASVISFSFAKAVDEPKTKSTESV